ncbi:TetR/AcrR family transcriptional regulator [Leifsonia sp. ALI-44-B]|uniref:TetR/AcrR family transcriptional regulator n=1 Tax=Leifsonia sp. ALI-44-B TaxID=1933776 RepID=UPI001EE75D16|nr:TetR/AcrR family transcriptional regulator [Leifsonia sp. ALI-44-B]
MGRPKLSSKQILEDAAAELFLEQTYTGTTIDQVARRAGVSRNTFFNYFGSKSDLLWVDVDTALDALETALAADASEPAASFAARIDTVCAALAEVAHQHPHSRVPLGFTQREIMGTSAELQASGLIRMSRAMSLIERSIGAPAAPSGATSSDTARPGAAARDADPLVVRSFAAAVVAAAAAGAMHWASAGVARGELADDIERAIRPVCSGFGA